MPNVDLSIFNGQTPDEFDDSDGYHWVKLLLYCNLRGCSLSHIKNHMDTQIPRHQKFMLGTRVWYIRTDCQFN
jgi:hypothetical protein